MRVRRALRGGAGLVAVVAFLGAGLGLVAVAALQGVGGTLRAPGVVLALGVELVVAALAIGAIAGRGRAFDDDEEHAHGVAAG